MWGIDRWSARRFRPFSTPENEETSASALKRTFRNSGASGCFSKKGADHQVEPKTGAASALHYNIADRRMTGRDLSTDAVAAGPQKEVRVRLARA